MTQLENREPKSPLEALRKTHYGLAALPETIRVPAFAGREAIETQPIELASLDDVAFALRALEAEFNTLADRMHALRKLYQIARDAGAVGADIALAAATRWREER